MNWPTSLAVEHLGAAVVGTDRAPRHSARIDETFLKPGALATWSWGRIYLRPGHRGTVLALVVGLRISP